LVLIVDDEYGPRESIAFSLSAEFETRTAGKASDALRFLAEQTFDLVLLDIRMPEMDGIRTLEEIRKIDAEISVILLTGYGTLATAQQAIVGGANQYLVSRLIFRNLFQRFVAMWKALQRVAGKSK